MQAHLPLLTCDGCGAPADESHLRQRIERLELITRFRPIHVQVVLLDLAPPPRLADFFYYPNGQSSERSIESRNYFDGLMREAGIPQDFWRDEESALAEFQRRGFFLAYVVECPLEDSLPAREVDSSKGIAPNIAPIFGPTILSRLQFSYKPKHIALLSPSLDGLIPLLEQAGWGNRLLLGQETSVGESPSKSSKTRRRLAEILPKATGE